jgi:hypothetical protein
VWWATTHQLPGISGSPDIAFAELWSRSTALLSKAAREALLLPTITLALAFATLIAAGGRAALSLTWYHRFSLISLPVIYAHTVIFDPYSPDNPRPLVPLYAHLLGWAILACRDTLQLMLRFPDSRQSSPAAWVAGGFALAGIVTLLTVTAISASLLGTPSPTKGKWEPVRLITSVERRVDYRDTLEHALRDRRARSATGLRVAFVGIDRWEYLKFWVAPFLYDQRSSGDWSNAEVIIASPDFQADGWRLSLALAPTADIARAIFLPSDSDTMRQVSGSPLE